MRLYLIDYIFLYIELLNKQNLKRIDYRVKLITKEEDDNAKN